MKVYTLATFLVLMAAPSLHAESIGNNTTRNGLSAQENERLRFSIDIPPGAANLTATIGGGSGDADLYLRAGSPPSSYRYDCRPYLPGNNENCTVSSPQTTTYYIDIVAFESFSSLSLNVRYQTNTDDNQEEITLINNGDQLSRLSANQNTDAHYLIRVPANTPQLKVESTGGSGDADLYVNASSKASQDNWDCRPYEDGNNETCIIDSPTAGDYYIMLRAYRAYSNLTLKATLQAANDDDNGNPDNTAPGHTPTWNGFEEYYAEVLELSGDSLLDGLQTAAARNQQRMSYSSVWTALKYTDEDPQNSNNVILIYSGRSQAKSFNASGNNDQDAWNREHCWPKSRGFPSSGDWAYTDIHHLRPADASINTYRSNKNYDNGGSPLAEAPSNLTDSDSFEPRDEVKGDVARMMFYMDIRYNGNDNTGTDDLKLVNFMTSSGPTLGRLCTLLEWHINDPVSSDELRRHSRIVERQGNRNPFVDNPAWAQQIWGAQCQ